MVWARNPESRSSKAKEWHWVQKCNLYKLGVGVERAKPQETQWEIDWSRRRSQKTPTGQNNSVWARNLKSKWRRCREWHWANYRTVTKSGVAWVKKEDRRPHKLLPGRVTVSGYVHRGPYSMTPGQIALADHCKLWMAGGGKQKYCMEHRLIAAEKYGEAVIGKIVRHLNGNKADNRPENLVLGSPKENTMDHVSLRAEVARLRARVEELEKK